MEAFGRSSSHSGDWNAGKVGQFGTYTGDPPSGLTTRETFLGWKSNQEVRDEVESRIRVFR